MSYSNVVANVCRTGIFSDMNDSVVLDICSEPDPDPVYISSDNDIEPKICFIAGDNVADDSGTTGNKRVPAQVWPDAIPRNHLCIFHDLHPGASTVNKQLTMARFNPHMKYWRTLLRDVFLLPEEFLVMLGHDLPRDLDELTRLSGLPMQEVEKKLARMASLMEPPVTISINELPAMEQQYRLAERAFLILDVRCSDDFKQDHLSGAVSIHDLDFRTWLEKEVNIQSSSQAIVTVIGSNNEQAWSAAMYLRDHGVREAYAVEF